MNKLIDNAPRKTECWNWEGAITSKGYGSVRVNGRNLGAHRVIYEALKKVIPDGKQLDHLCRNRRCVNPWHLEVVSSKENTLRGIGPTAINAKKTQCANGHSLEGSYVYPKGNRSCEICRQESRMKWQRANLKQPKAVLKLLDDYKQT
jgi:hypothetical protein